MTSVFRAYIAGGRTSLIIGMIFALGISVITAFAGFRFYSLAVPIATVSSMFISGSGTCFAKYFRVMPVRASIKILSDYAYHMILLITGLALAAVVAIIIGDYYLVSFNIILLVLGYALIYQGFYFPLKYRNPHIGIALIVVPVPVLYLVFGGSNVHGIVSSAVSGIPVTEVDIFSNTAHWLVFMAISLAIYIGSYFATVASYKKSRVN